MYNTPEWYSSLRDVGMLWQALGGVTIFWTSLPKRDHSRLRSALFWILGGGLLWVSRRFGWLFLESGTNVYLVYFFSVIYVVVCCKSSVWVALTVGSSGFLAQQICGSLELALRSIPAIGAAFDYSSAIVVLDIVFFSAGYYLIWRVFHGRSLSGNENISALQMGSFSTLALIFSLGFYTLNQYVRGWASLTTIELTVNSFYNAIGSVLLLVMQYELIRQQRLNIELQAMRAILRTQEDQWRQSKERTELVNEKYHDLKKIVNSFRSDLDAGMIQKLNEAIEAYDDKVDTGNSAADVVLTEARELCRGQGIQFTCYVNGPDLDFMEDLEIYTFLKNAVDNAVEAVEKLPEGKERFISLTARSEDGIIILHEENPCGDVIFENGLPKTQQDSDYHGFGMKSMMRIANKYGGALTASARNGIFYLDAIFMPE